MALSHSCDQDFFFFFRTHLLCVCISFYFVLFNFSQYLSQSTKMPILYTYSHLYFHILLTFQFFFNALDFISIENASITLPHKRKYAGKKRAWALEKESEIKSLAYVLHSRIHIYIYWNEIGSDGVTGSDDCVHVLSSRFFETLVFNKLVDCIHCFTLYAHWLKVSAYTWNGNMKKMRILCPSFFFQQLNRRKKKMRWMNERSTQKRGSTTDFLLTPLIHMVYAVVERFSIGLSSRGEKKEASNPRKKIVIVFRTWAEGLLLRAECISVSFFFVVVFYFWAHCRKQCGK